MLYDIGAVIVFVALCFALVMSYRMDRRTEALRKLLDKHVCDALERELHDGR